MSGGRRCVAALVAVVAGAGAGWAGGLEAPAGAAPGTRVTIFDAEPNAKRWRFEPADLTVKAGASVVWHNGGNQDHTVTAMDGSFDSGNKKPGTEWRRTFSRPGTYAYYCKPHPWMKARIRVVR